MKTQVNKSRLMKRAWAIYKGVNPYSYSFSAALRRAWEVGKPRWNMKPERHAKPLSRRRTPQGQHESVMQVQHG